MSLYQTLKEVPCPIHELSTLKEALCPIHELSALLSIERGTLSYS